MPSVGFRSRNRRRSRVAFDLILKSLQVLLCRAETPTESKGPKLRFDGRAIQVDVNAGRQAGKHGKKGDLGLQTFNGHFRLRIMLPRDLAIGPASRHVRSVRSPDFLHYLLAPPSPVADARAPGFSILPSNRPVRGTCREDQVDLSDGQKRQA